MEWLALVAYAALVTWETLHHVPWADEAQSWLIARDSTFSQLFFTRLHYEGTPGLWHFLLWMFAHLHGSYAGVHWLTAGIGVFTAWVILRYAPFSLPIRLLLPFGFSFVLQTAVVSRSYSLVPLLAFGLCILMHSRRDRPFIFALLAGLLANTAIIPALMSAGFGGAYILQRSRRNKAIITHRFREDWLPFAVTLSLLWAVAIWTAVPAPDVSYGLGAQLSAHPGYVRVVSKVTGIANLPVQTSGNALPNTPADAPRMPAGINRLQRRIWDYVNGPSHHGLVGHLVTRAVLELSLAFYPVSQWSALAAIFYIAWLAWTIRKKVLWSLLPFAATFAGISVLPFSEHHIVIVWSSLIASLWMAVDAEVRKEGSTNSGMLENALGAVLLVIVLEQACWTGNAVRMEAKRPFDGSQEAALFIQEHALDHSIAGFSFYSIAVNAYFPHIAFSNQSSAFWPWNQHSDPDLALAEVIGKKPQFILLGEGHLGTSLWMNQVTPIVPSASANEPAPMAAYLAANGFREAHRFCGVQPAHFSYAEEDCENIWEADPSPLTR